MRKFIFFLLISTTITSNSVLAETLDEKVARNAANCLVGHIATNSKKYQSGDSAQYLLLIKSIVGDEKTSQIVKKSATNLKSSIQLIGGSSQNEGAWLIKTYCPSVDDLLAK